MLRLYIAYVNCLNHLDFFPLKYEFSPGNLNGSSSGITDIRDKILHGVQLKMISVVNFFCIFEIIIFCFVVAICDLMHVVEAMYGLP